VSSFVVVTHKHSSNSFLHKTVRCKDEFEQNLTAETLATMQGSGEKSSSMDEQVIDIWNDYCQLVDEISKNSTIGSDEKFQLFICLCLR
jgi:hypothetical protein